MSKIEIVNRALMKLGEPPISSLNDAVFGKSYEVIYDDVKRLLLSIYPWRFAVDMQKLNRLDTKKNDKFLYVMPNDCLLLLKVYGNYNSNITYEIHNEYEVLGNYILCDLDDGIKIEYVKNIKEEFFIPLFREAIAAKLASELAMRIKHSLEIKQMMESEFFTLIKHAELNNEIMKDIESIPDNSWIVSRKTW